MRRTATGPVLGLLAVGIGGPGLLALAFGSQAGPPLIGVVGIVLLLQASMLLQAAGSGRSVPILGLVIVPFTATGAFLGGLWGLVAPLPASSPTPPSLLGAFVVAGLLAMASARYVAEAQGLEKGPSLARWGRFVVWAVGLLLAVDGALALHPSSLPMILATRGLGGLLAGVGAFNLLRAMSDRQQERSGDRPDLPPLRWLFSRWNPIASVGDALQDGLGIDLRTTWAIQFVRAAVEPMVVAILLLGWGLTGIVRVAPEEVAIHERLGVPLSSEPVGPGLHWIAPWPVDRLRRVPVKRVATMAIGEEEGHAEEEGHSGPEHTLWAKMHGDAEYTLLLGDGNDLVTIDGLLHYRIADPHAYLYGAQNPEEGLKAAAYEALTLKTVGRSLDDVLSENLAAFSDEVVEAIRQRSVDLELGLEPVSFTLKGLHPPFDVARDYQAVVSAQIDQRSDIIEAQRYRVTTLPDARAEARAAVDTATAVSTSSRAEAVGEAAAFASLVDTYEAQPALFRFRRRMEGLETRLEERALTLIDQRLEAQGADLWVMP